MPSTLPSRLSGVAALPDFHAASGAGSSICLLPSGGAADLLCNPRVQALSIALCNLQILLVSGNGVLHPQRCGLASQLGVQAGIPTIGVVDSLLLLPDLQLHDEKAVRAALVKQATCGNPNEQFAEEVHQRRLAFMSQSNQPLRRPLTPQPLEEARMICLQAESETLGAAVCQASMQRPVYVSVGHRVCLSTAVAVYLACSHHRIPEPLRFARIAAKQAASS